MKYNIEDDTWNKLPSMTEGRFCPGVFITPSEDKYLYAFGGLVDSVERISLNSSFPKW